jgi:hypothetical protein
MFEGGLRGSRRREKGADLERVNLEIEILVLYQTVDPFRQDTLEVALTRSSSRIGRHHPRHGRVGS